jgi:two-component system phosphate regulon sensor histidine kinase PhoR
VPLELIVRVERALRWRRLRQEADRLLLEIAGDKTRLRTVVDSLADAVIIVNIEDQVVLSNPAACEALGVTVPHHEPCDIELVSTSPELLELIRGASGGEDGAACSRSGRLELGGKVYMARVAPIIAPGAGLLGTATVLRDITDLSRLEQEKSRFMSLVAHELKSPLAAVQGFLKVILSGQELAPEQLQRLIERCSERVDGMAQLVRDLLDLSRSEAAPERHLEEIALEEILTDVLEQNEPLAERCAVTVETHLAAEVPALYADRDDLLRIFGNLVSNALKYNHPGGTVTISSRNQGDRLWVEVADTGLGIPPEALARLGEEFFRVNSPERRNIVGTGLGLSLVKRTLEACGGSLRIDSTPGEGSRFTVLLPWR